VNNDILEGWKVTDGIVEIDRTIKVGAKFIRWSPHVADEHACAAHRQTRCRARNRGLFEIAACDFGSRGVKV
jgi:hypothetical protein